MDLEPQLLLPAMPPMVQRAQVEGSTGKNLPCGFSASFSAPSVMPGCTRATSPSTLTIFRKCLLQSSTRPLFTVCPHCDVPPPRARTEMPSSRASVIAACTSSMVFGTTTPTGITW